MNRQTQIRAYVGMVCFAATGAFIWTFSDLNAQHSLWDIASFFLFALLLEQAGSPMRLGATGSTSFIIHMAAGILYGPFWGALVTGLSTAVSQVISQRPAIKVLFNTAQRVLSVVLGVQAYIALGGSTPPSYLSALDGFASPDGRRDFLLFFALAAIYFAINAVAVNAAVALSSGRRFRDVWNLNARGVLGYDLGASTLAVLLVWLYSKSASYLGFGAIGFALVLIPILAIRHIYGLYRKLQSSGRELLDLMVKAIEARDPYTSGHSVRVATLAKAIAEQMKVSAEEVEEIYTAAVLHDVGKIHEEYAPLLRKETKLTPEETALLQTHAVKSAELVGIISSFRGNILSAVRSHHERWDGGGYPDGLSGTEIPLGARIIMISDTTDAMTTDRPYRSRLSTDAVISELQRHRGTQFDPQLVDLVVSSVAIRRVMTDLQSPASPQGDASDLVGGSRRVSARPPGSTSARPSWARLRAF